MRYKQTQQKEDPEKKLSYMHQPIKFKKIPAKTKKPLKDPHTTATTTFLSSTEDEAEMIKNFRTQLRY